jgi:hypothetical protein
MQLVIIIYVLMEPLLHHNDVHYPMQHNVNIIYFVVPVILHAVLILPLHDVRMVHGGLLLLIHFVHKLRVMQMQKFVLTAPLLVVTLKIIVNGILVHKEDALRMRWFVRMVLLSVVILITIVDFINVDQLFVLKMLELVLMGQVLVVILHVVANGFHVLTIQRLALRMPEFVRMGPLLAETQTTTVISFLVLENAILILTIVMVCVSQLHVIAVIWLHLNSLIDVMMVPLCDMMFVHGTRTADVLSRWELVQKMLLATMIVIVEIVVNTVGNQVVVKLIDSKANAVEICLMENLNVTPNTI